MKNKDKYNLRELLFSRECASSYILHNGKYIAKFNNMNSYEYFNAVIDWLEQEYQEPPILDGEEKEYLKAVIKPWQDRVVYIYKHEYCDEEYISIIYRDGLYENCASFPSFKKGTMYKGMELNRKYTLEELGL